MRRKDGLFSKGPQTTRIRLLGLHCMEHIITIKWNLLSPDEQSFLKDQVRAYLLSSHVCETPNSQMHASNTYPYHIRCSSSPTIQLHLLSIPQSIAVLTSLQASPQQSIPQYVKEKSITMAAEVSLSVFMYTSV